jgi:hypothetical protein
VHDAIRFSSVYDTNAWVQICDNDFSNFILWTYIRKLNRLFLPAALSFIKAKDMTRQHKCLSSFQNEQFRYE